MRYPLFWLSWPLLAGLLAACSCPGSWVPCLVAASLCAVLACLRSRPAPLALAVGALLLGWAAPSLVSVGPRLDGAVVVSGRVLAVRCGGQHVIELEGVSAPGAAWRPASGRVLVRFGDPAPRQGDRVIVLGEAGSLERAVLPGGPNSIATAVLAGARCRVRCRRWLPLGCAFTPRLSPPPCTHQGLLRALALGDRTQVPEGIPELLRATGTSHLLAISGLHLGLVAGLLGWLACRCARLVAAVRSRSRAWLPGALVLVASAWGYGWLAGWPASATRAALMLAGAGLALALERGRDPRQLLGAACFCTVLLEPALAATAGWQLSFGALLGLLLVAPRLVRLLPPDLPRPLDRLARGVFATVAATVGTLPAAAWWFQELALTAAAANLVAIPLVGLVATPAALLSVALPGTAGRLAASVSCASLDLVLAWLEIVRGPCLAPAVGPLGALLLLGLALLARRPFLAALTGLVALGLRLVPRARLVITFLAVGQGSAILVEWPDGRRWLVDAGPSEQAVLRYLRRRGVRWLDVVVATHPHPDHIGGIPAVLSELEPEALWLPRLPLEGEEEFVSLVRGAREVGAEVLLSDDPRVPALHPLSGWTSDTNANEDSLVLELALGRHVALLTGDVESRAEAALLPMLHHVDVLGVPHHGSGSSSGPAFVQATRPTVAVVSCGLDNHFGHPHPKVVARYRDALLLRTDQHGTVQVSSDGLHLDVRSWLPGRGWKRWDLSAAEQGRYPTFASFISVGSSGLTRSAASPASSSVSSESSRNR